MKSTAGDFQDLKTFFENLTPEEVVMANKKEEERLKIGYEAFQSAFRKGECSLCGRPLKVFSSEKPCLHYLLRQSKQFKKKHFTSIYKIWGYFNIASYLRWVANQDRFLANINNLEDEKGKGKKFEYTIQWKNLEWTFSCSEGDFQGHGGIGSNFPHYHFQMRIDRRPFIDFTDAHIPFSDEDLFNFASMEGGFMEHSWGNGVGIQDALELIGSLPGYGIDEMSVSSSEAEAQFRVQTFINGPVSGDDLAEIIKESNRTGQTMASLAKKKFGEEKVVSTVSPIETIPDIARRKPRGQ